MHLLCEASWQKLEERWLQFPWKKKAYDTNKVLALLVLQNAFVPGLVRFLKQWKAMVGEEVLLDI